MIGRKPPTVSFEGDTNRWYLPGRNKDFHGRFSLTEAEFKGVQSLVPLVVQIRQGRLEVTCVNAADERELNLMLLAIRQTFFHSADATAGESA